jgi:hypothetical protein
MEPDGRTDGRSGDTTKYKTGTGRQTCEALMLSALGGYLNCGRAGAVGTGGGRELETHRRCARSTVSHPSSFLNGRKKTEPKRAPAQTRPSPIAHFFGASRRVQKRATHCRSVPSLCKVVSEMNKMVRQAQRGRKEIVEPATCSVSQCLLHCCGIKCRRDAADTRRTVSRVGLTSPVPSFVWVG